MVKGVSDSVITKQMFMRLPVFHPVPVCDRKGSLLGSAVVELVPGGLSVSMTLDKNRPESFDIELDDRRVSIEVCGGFDKQGLKLSIVVDT